MKKGLLTITAISIISITGISSFNFSQPTSYAQTKKSFTQEVQGKWTNPQHDEFTINNSTAKLKIARGKHHGIYKFKVTSINHGDYKLKAQGKKIAKQTKYSLKNSDNGKIEFKYGKQKITFTSQSVKISEQTTSTSTSSNVVNPAQPTPDSQNQSTPTPTTSPAQPSNSDYYNVYTNPEIYSSRGF